MSVLLPIFFLGGLTGLLFREFGLTLAAAVIISSFVALTLTPVIATRLLKKREKHSWLYEKTEPFFESLTDRYRTVLDTVLQRRWLAWPVLGVSLGLVVLFFQILPAELAPMEDRSTLRISSRGQEGATFAYMDAYMDDQIALARQVVPEATTIITVTSPGFGASSAVNNGYMRLRLVPPEERERSQMEIANAFETALQGLQGARTFVTQDPTIAVGRRRGLPVQFVLQAPDLERLEDILPVFLERAAAEPAFSVVDLNL